MMKIALGSSSLHKIKAVNQTIDWLIGKFGDKFHLSYDDVETGVPNQPIGFSEISFGSDNRAWNILRKQNHPDYAIGIESGLVEVEEHRCSDWSKNSFDYCVYEMASIHLLYKQTNSSYACLTSWSTGIKIPNKYYEKFLEHKKNNPNITLGQSMLKLGLDFDGTDLTSYLTNNVISRSDLLVDSIKLVFAQALKLEKMK